MLEHLLTGPDAGRTPAGTLHGLLDEAFDRGPGGRCPVTDDGAGPGDLSPSTTMVAAVAVAGTVRGRQRGRQPGLLARHGRP